MTQDWAERAAEQITGTKYPENAYASNAAFEVRYRDLILAIRSAGQAEVRAALERAADLCLLGEHGAVNATHPPDGPEDYTRGWIDSSRYWSEQIRALSAEQPGGEP